MISTPQDLLPQQSRIKRSPAEELKYQLNKKYEKYVFVPVRGTISPITKAEFMTRFFQKYQKDFQKQYPTRFGVDIADLLNDYEEICHQITSFSSNVKGKIYQKEIAQELQQLSQIGLNEYYQRLLDDMSKKTERDFNWQNLESHIFGRQFRNRRQALYFVQVNRILAKKNEQGLIEEVIEIGQLKTNCSSCKAPWTFYHENSPLCCSNLSCVDHQPARKRIVLFQRQFRITPMSFSGYTIDWDESLNQYVDHDIKIYQKQFHNSNNILSTIKKSCKNYSSNIEWCGSLAKINLNTKQLRLLPKVEAQGVSDAISYQLSSCLQIQYKGNNSTVVSLRKIPEGSVVAVCGGRMYRSEQYPMKSKICDDEERLMISFGWIRNSQLILISDQDRNVVFYMRNEKNGNLQAQWILIDERNPTLSLVLTANREIQANQELTWNKRMIQVQERGNIMKRKPLFGESIRLNPVNE